MIRHGLVWLSASCPADFVLICATASNFYALYDILDILESITCVFSIPQSVGAPGLDSETWDTKSFPSADFDHVRRRGSCLLRLFHHLFRNRIERRSLRALRSRQRNRHSAIAALAYRRHQLNRSQKRHIELFRRPLCAAARKD